MQVLALLGPLGLALWPQKCKSISYQHVTSRHNVWDNWDPLEGTKRGKRPNLTHFGHFWELGDPMWATTLSVDHSNPLHCSGHPTQLYCKKKLWAIIFGGIYLSDWDQKWPFWPWTPLDKPKTMLEGLTIVVTTEKDLVLQFGTNCINLE